MPTATLSTLELRELPKLLRTQVSETPRGVLQHIQQTLFYKPLRGFIWYSENLF